MGGDDDYRFLSLISYKSVKGRTEGMKSFEFPYGKGSQRLVLDERHIQYYLAGSPSGVISDEETAIRDSLRHPIDSRPLLDCVKPDGTIVIIVSDITRAVHTDRMLRAIASELEEAGISDDQITVLVALGTHRQQTEEETAAVCGKDMVRRLKVVQHDCHDDNQLVSVGTTSYGNDVRLNRLAVEADTVILTGAVSFHDMAGFGGGRKAVLPGIAGYDTIMTNHALALNDACPYGMDPRCDAGKLADNPIHCDMMEGAAFLRPAFLVNLVLTADGGLHDVVSGNWRTAWQEGCRRLLALDGVPVGHLSDVVIGSAGGHPKDINLYQATKAHMNAVFAVKPGGILILAMACPDMYEPADFTDWFFRDDLDAVLAAVRQHFTIPAFSAYKTRCLIRMMKEVYIVTDRAYFDVIRRTGEIPAATMEEAWQMAQKTLQAENKKDYTITVMPYAAATLPVYQKG